MNSYMVIMALGALIWLMFEVGRLRRQLPNAGGKAQLEQKLEQLEQQNQDLKQRVEALETIISATSFDLKSEINKLD